MPMRPIALVTILIALTLAGCGKEPEVAAPSSRPVKVFTVESPRDQAIRNFPGNVQASQRADLSFRVPGVLNEMLVKEGDTVESGQLLARLDPTDYKITLEDRQATFDNAQRNFERGKELVKDGNISKLDFDRMEANFRTAQAALSQAQQDLEYTELRAPFAGTIGRRLVENFEEVAAKQTIFNFVDLKQLDIYINLPESLVRRFRTQPEELETGTADKGARDKVISMAAFEGRPDIEFPLSIKEIATRADPQTQTFRVTLTMPQPDAFSVLPGMTANVRVDFSKIIAANSAKWVPISAVQADAGLQARVWTIDPETMTVNSQPVEIGRMSGDRIEITDGLFGGEEIVSVGAAYLSEGMRVTRMRQTEQAVPREDDA